MMTKTINQVLAKKVEQWLKTIDDNELVKDIRNGLVITGGCFTSMIMNEEPKDYDCYFKTKELTLKVAEYYAKVWNDAGKSVKVEVIDCDEEFEKVTESAKSANHFNLHMPSDENRIKMFIRSDGVVGDIESIRSDEELGLEPGGTEEIIQELDEISADEIISKEKKEYFPVFISDNAITLSNGIQIVVRFFGEPDKVHDTFDFVHTRAYWTNQSKTVIPNEVYEATINKTLIYTGSRYPVCSVFRLRKFIQRGWRINVGQILKMCMQISELDLSDVNVLSDQLIGVDSLLFSRLIENLRKKKEGDQTFDLTSSYIISLVDKMF